MTTVMAASCSFVCCGEEKEADKAVVGEYSSFVYYVEFFTRIMMMTHDSGLGFVEFIFLKHLGAHVGTIPCCCVRVSHVCHCTVTSVIEV